MKRRFIGPVHSIIGVHRMVFRQRPADHEHEWAPHPLGGDFTCLICNLAASDAWEIVRSEEVLNEGAELMSNGEVDGEVDYDA